MTILNPLPPAKREKNRYLVYNVVSDSKLKSDEMGKAIWKEALSFLGELGVSRTSLRIIDFDEKKQKGIIKVNRDSVEEGRLVLSLVRQAGKKKLRLDVLGVSGILKKAKGKFL